jgi:hypothetical protein
LFVPDQAGTPNAERDPDSVLRNYRGSRASWEAKTKWLCEAKTKGSHMTSRENGSAASCDGRAEAKVSTGSLERREFLKRTALLLPAAWFGANIIIPRQAYATDRIAASPALADVQAAVNAAVDGDRVLIPNGSATWTGGISTTKQIRIEAQNYTPTPMGTPTLNVTLTCNSSVPMIQLTSGNSFHVGVAGIRFNEGTGMVNHIRFNGSGSRVPLLNDCYFQVRQRNGNEPDVAQLAWLSQGGVAWNCYWDGTAFPGGVGGSGPDGACLLVNSPRAWNTPSTLGALDTNGTTNVYVEDSTFVNVGQCPDIDDNGRYVSRHNLINGTGGLTHGFTSMWGGRHFEYYNNTFTTTIANRNLGGRYFWARAGHGVFTDNTVSAQNQGYGTPMMLDTGDNMSPTTLGPYPLARQPGWGFNTLSVIDPIYIWNQTGDAARYVWGTQSGWASYIQANREVFANAGAKPGYSKFPYPHPLRGDSPPTTPAPAPPNGLQISKLLSRWV